MPELKRYRLFASHAWHRSDEYLRIFEFLDSANNFIYANYSVPVDRAFEGLNNAQLAAHINNQIKPVQCVIILGGLYVSYSAWIQYEIDYAKSLSKPIIGITPRGAQRMPLAVQNAANIVVGWNTNSIVDAIRQYSI